MTHINSNFMQNKFKERYIKEITIKKDWQTQKDKGLGYAVWQKIEQHTFHKDKNQTFINTFNELVFWKNKQRLQKFLSKNKDIVNYVD